MALKDLFYFTFSVFPTHEQEKLNQDMHSTLGQLHKMAYNLEKLKRENNLKLILDKEGNLSIDAPNTISDNDLLAISKRVGIIDRVYNSQLEEYNKLMNKDRELNESHFSTGFDKSYNTVTNLHKNVFTREN